MHRESPEQTDDRQYYDYHLDRNGGSLEAEDKALKQHRCWDCKYCDKESVLKGNKWILTRTGYCLAGKSAVNGETGFYKKVYVNTTYNNCNQFEPCG